MVKGFIEKVVKTDYLFKVRIPTYHRIQNTPGATPTEDLPDSPVCTTPGVNPHYQVGDIVWCEFENDEIGHPVIVGLLYREEGSESTSDIQADSIIANVNAEFPEETKIGEVSQSIQALPQIQQQVIDGISSLQDNKVSKSGDTMTGILNIKRADNDGSAIIIYHNFNKGDTPTASQSKYITFYSKDSKNLGLVLNNTSTANFSKTLLRAYSNLGSGFADLYIQNGANGVGVPYFQQGADTVLGVEAAGPWELWHKGNLPIEELNPTATTDTSISIARSKFYHIGNVVLVQAVFTTTATVATNTNLFTGLPKAVQTIDMPCTNNGGTTNRTVYVNTSGQLKVSGSFAAGGYTFNGWYLSS